MIMILSITYMERVDKSYIARTSGIMGALSMSATPFGSFIVSGICLVLSTNQLFLVVGILIFIFFLLQIFNKEFRAL